MNLEDQVCSLELAKRLKSLGVKQESLFYYRAWENPLNGHVSEDKVTDDFWSLFYCDDKYSKSCDWEIGAFTVAELGEMLPSWIKQHHLIISKSSTWFLKYRSPSSFIPKDHEPEIEDVKEANARALMLIYLIEHGLLNAADI